MAQFLAQRWRRQPQGPVAVDWNNPLARGLIALATPSNSLLQTVAPGSSFAGSANRSTGATGVAWSFDGTSTGMSAAQSASPTTATLYAFANFPSQAGAGTFVALGTASSNRYVVMDMIGSDLRAIQNDGSFGGITAFGVPVGRWVHYASVHASSGNVVYVDGIQFASGSGGGLPISTTFDVGTLFQGGFSNRGNGAIAVAAAWGRALSEAEHKTLSENPWQLFRAPRPIIYSLPSSTVPVLSAATAIDIGSTSARPRVTITI